MHFCKLNKDKREAIKRMTTKTQKASREKYGVKIRQEVKLEA